MSVEGQWKLTQSTSWSTLFLTRHLHANLLRYSNIAVSDSPSLQEFGKSTRLMK